MAATSNSSLSAANKVWMIAELRDTILQHVIANGDAVTYRHTLSQNQTTKDAVHSLALASRDTARSYQEALLDKILLSSSSLLIIVVDLDFYSVTKFFASMDAPKLDQLRAQQGQGPFPLHKTQKLSIELRFSKTFLQCCAAKQPLDETTMKAILEWEDLVMNKDDLWMDYKCMKVASRNMDYFMKEILESFAWETPRPVKSVLSEREQSQAAETERCDLAGNIKKVVLRRLRLQFEEDAVQSGRYEWRCGTGRRNGMWRLAYVQADGQSAGCTNGTNT